MSKIYLIRHGITKYNVENRIQGELDSHLTEDGKKYSEKVGRYIQKESSIKDFLFYTSPLIRCLETSQIIADKIGLAYDTDNSIVELKRGILEGKIKNELNSTEQKAYSAFKKDMWNYRVKGGESLKDLQIRLIPFVQKIKATNRGSIIVSHGFTLRMLVLLLCNKDSEYYDKIHFPHNTVTTIIDEYQINQFSINE